MDNQETICLAFLSAILVICYLSPNYIECFGNMEFFGNEDTPPQVGYQHSIIRPPANTNYSTGTTLCSWPLYSGNGDKQSWCSEKNAIQYYAMRPLKTPQTYNSWLDNLFTVIVNPGDSVSKILGSKLLPLEYNRDGTAFDVDYEKKNVMEWIMQRVAWGVNKIPSMKKNSTWGNEEFHYTDDDMYAFTASNNGGNVYKLTFNLYNPLRSTSTSVECVVLKPIAGSYVLAKMNFMNKGEWTCCDKFPDGINGFNLPKSTGGIGIDVNTVDQTSLMNWNYGNTLNEQEFNKFGVNDPLTNINIQGGVPESLRKALAKYG